MSAVPALASSPRVLIVDDDHDAVASSSLVLRECGFAVQTASDDRTALCAAMQTSPNLVLLSLGVPQLNGGSLAQALKESIRPPAPLLVAVSQSESPDRMIRSAETGFDLHLVKPLRPWMLTNLARLASRAQAAFETARRLAEDYQRAVAALFREQLRMADTYVELASLEKVLDRKQHFIWSAYQLCQGVAAKTADCPGEQIALDAQIISLQTRITAIAYQSIDQQ